MICTLCKCKRLSCQALPAHDGWHAKSATNHRYLWSHRASDCIAICELSSHMLHRCHLSCSLNRYCHWHMPIEPCDGLGRIIDIALPPTVPTVWCLQDNAASCWYTGASSSWQRCGLASCALLWPTPPQTPSPCSASNFQAKRHNPTLERIYPAKHR